MSEILKAQHAAIVSVDRELSWSCSECWTSVQGRAHIVADGDEWLILHSSCMSRRYGSEDALGAPRCGPTAHEVGTRHARALRKGLRHWLAQYHPQRHLAPGRKACLPEAALLTPEQRGWGDAPPWPWWRRGSEFTAYTLLDGSRWILSEHEDGSHKLIAWPAFAKWHMWFPKHLARTSRKLGVLTVLDVEGLKRHLQPLLRSRPASGNEWLEFSRSNLLWMV